MTGAELKASRIRMKMTQAQFADHLGVSQEMVSMMETGTKQVPRDVAQRLSRSSSLSRAARVGRNV